MLRQVPNTGYGELLVAAGDPPSLIVNRDPANALILTDDSSTFSKGTALGANISMLDPLGSIVVTGNKNVYGLGLQSSGTITIDVQQETGYWSPSPAQIITQLELSTLPTLIADAVQTAGVPPIDIPAPTYITLGSDVPAAGAGVFSSGHISMSKYQSYTMIIKAGNGHNNAMTIPFQRVRFAWSLAADNYDPIHVEDWVIPTGPFSFTFNYINYAAGPCYSDTLDITVTGYDTVTETIIIGVFGSYRTRSRSVMRGAYNWFGSGAPNEAAGLGSDGILASVSGTNLAAGASTTPQLVNIWHGNAALYLSSVDAAVDDLEVHIQPQPIGTLTNEPDIVLTMDGAGPDTRLTDILLPRRVCTIFFVNAGVITIPNFQAQLVMDGVTE